MDSVISASCSVLNEDPAYSGNVTDGTDTSINPAETMVRSDTDHLHYALTGTAALSLHEGALKVRARQEPSDSSTVASALAEMHKEAGSLTIRTLSETGLTAYQCLGSVVRSLPKLVSIADPISQVGKSTLVSDTSVCARGLDDSLLCIQGMRTSTSTAVC